MPAPIWALTFSLGQSRRSQTRRDLTFASGSGRHDLLEWARGSPESTRGGRVAGDSRGELRTRNASAAHVVSRVGFVNLAEDFFDDVFNGHDSEGVTVHRGDDRQMTTAALHVSQQINRQV